MLQTNIAAIPAAASRYGRAPGRKDFFHVGNETQNTNTDAAKPMPVSNALKIPRAPTDSANAAPPVAVRKFLKNTAFRMYTGMPAEAVSLSSQSAR